MAEESPNVVDSQEDDYMAEKIINEEYKVWKKNAPFLYDCVVTTALEWPTLTTQWFPDKQSIPDRDYSTHRLLIGTHTNGAPNYLQIAQVTLPNPIDPDAADYDEDKEEIGGYGGGSSKKSSNLDLRVTIIQKIDHSGEINKARYQPQNPNIIATMCTDGRTLIFDKSKHPSMPTGTVNPQAECIGHTREGFGLSWSPKSQGKLVTGSEDKTVKIWDMQGYTSSNKALSPVTTYTHHSAIVNDVQYHPTVPHWIGTVSDDKTLQIVDVRSPNSVAVLKCENGHDDAINALAFNPELKHLVATGSSDKTIALWDLRYTEEKINTFVGHTDSVTSLEWAPLESGILGSSSYDRRVLVWDLSKIGEEQKPEDKEDGPPELLFMHGGHTNRISDFSWNLNDPWVVCSAAEDNLVQVWRIANRIVGEEAAEDGQETQIENVSE